MHERVEQVEEDRVVAARARRGRDLRHSGLLLAKPSSRPCQCETLLSPYFQQRFTTRPCRRCGKSTRPSARSLMVPPIPMISARPALTVSVSRATCSISAFQAARSITPPPACPIRSRSASSRPAIAVACSFARMMLAMTRVSVGMSVSTSPGSKYRSAMSRQAAVDEDRMNLLGAVHAARERQLDVGGATRSRDEVDHGAALGRRRALVPRLQREPDVLQRLHECVTIEDGDVTGR